MQQSISELGTHPCSYYVIQWLMILGSYFEEYLVKMGFTVFASLLQWRSRDGEQSWLVWQKKMAVIWSLDGGGKTIDSASYCWTF